ncbi:hypothetical protein [Brachyspira pilosicoli]|uniref:hypothetical protein n=1 Tax=Brachyspira pilosicoli TaxID=52584 RepID=UPI0012F4A63C|nr:hypothetical protein [Brachyspira pilosicoli]
MKKLHILLVAIMLMLIACARPFDSRYYYNQRVDSSKGDNNVDTTPETPPEAVDPNEDPFLNGYWNKPNYGGYDASKFDTWLFKASFQKDKLPIYTFFNDTQGRYWMPGGKDWNDKPAYYYKGIDGENYADSSFVTANITGLTVYKYKSENPLYSSSGYLPGRIDRFNFYSIDGKAAIVTLKQYLIAVDTYSKFIFAYGKITKVDTVFGGEKVPMGFEAIEKYAEKRPFFEYDPIGYIKDDGSVVLFEHYIKEFVASPTTYEPKIHLEFTNMAKHEEKGQGYSPYLPKKDLESTTLDEITVSAKSLKNISARSKDVTWNSGSSPLNVAYLAYGVGGIVYNDTSSTDIELYKNLYADKPGTGTLVSKLQELAVESYIDINSGKTYQLKSIDTKSGYIDLASSIHKYNDRLYFADTAGFNSNGSGTIADRNQIKLHLKYDKDKQLFYIDKLINTSLDTTVTYDITFTLARGQTKDLTIKYKWMNGNDPNGEEIEVTYTLGFKSLK